MDIVIVEDDHLQADWIQENIEDGLPGVRITRIKTESEFRMRLEEIVRQQPAIIVMDVMLRWANPELGLWLPDDEETRRGRYRAGLRCARLLEMQEDTRHIPVVLYTVLEKSDLGSDLENAPPAVVHLAKDSDPGPLLELIRELTHKL